MKITYSTIIVSGLESLQQFVPVQAETGLLVSSGSIRVTGAQTQPAIVEVRTPPTRTFETPTRLVTESRATARLTSL